jgi:magnesium transporter
MLRTYILQGDGTVSRDTTPEVISQAFKSADARFWLDMEDPTDGELDLLRSIFNFHPLALEDTRGHLQRPKVEGYFWHEPKPDQEPDYFYIVMHGPDLETFKARDCHEVDMFLGERFLVTVHDTEMPAISNRRKRLEENAKPLLELGMDRLLYVILDEMVDQYQPILDELSDALDELDDLAASDYPPRDLPKRISEKKRMLIYLRTLAGPQREVVAQLTRGDVWMIRESTRVYLRDVQDHLIRLYENVELYRDVVMSARDIYLSSISNHLNQIMKTLTIISVIGLPLTVITGFFGMNFDAIPGLHSPTGFWWTVAVMAIAVTTMLFVFRAKRWI